VRTFFFPSVLFQVSEVSVVFIALVLAMDVIPIMGVLSQTHCLKVLWVKYH